MVDQLLLAWARSAFSSRAMVGVDMASLILHKILHADGPFDCTA